MLPVRLDVDNTVGRTLEAISEGERAFNMFLIMTAMITGR